MCYVTPKKLYLNLSYVIELYTILQRTADDHFVYEHALVSSSALIKLIVVLVVNVNYLVMYKSTEEYRV
jgi:hypothetical protein